ncbi:MAG: NHL repeat-containing protein [bacterium]
MGLKRILPYVLMLFLCGCSGALTTLERGAKTPVRLVRVGTFGEEQLLSPVSICSDVQGSIYVGDEARMGVEKFGPDFLYEGEFGEFGQGDSQLISPVHLSCDGFYIYVVDGRNERIARYDRYGGFSRLIVPVGTDTLGSGLPTAVAVSRTGEMYIAETRPGQVLALDEFGRLKFAFGRFGGISGLNSPTSIAVGPSSDIYVCDSGNRRVAVYDLFGGYLREIRGFVNPSGVNVDQSGNAFVSDLSNGTVACFDPEGNRVALIGGFLSPRALEVTGDGRLLIVDTENGFVAICKIYYR